MKMSNLKWLFLAWLAGCNAACWLRRREREKLAGSCNQSSWPSQPSAERKAGWSAAEKLRSGRETENISAM